VSNLYNTVIIGGGAAGMHCAAHALDAGPVLVIDHAQKSGEKIRISGGGRSNFTNLGCSPGNFISHNPHFAKSALARYSQWDFIDLINRHGIAYHEKTLGQLFCDGSADQIIQMLKQEMLGSELRLATTVVSVQKTDLDFEISLDSGETLRTNNLVIATGGKSIPKIGASGFGYQIARQFEVPLIETRPGLVPLTFSESDLAFLKPLAGLSLDVSIQCGKSSFQEAMLFTHRGLSGPAILQISSYWREGDPITIDLCPGVDCYEVLRAARSANGKRAVATVLADILPKRLASVLSDHWGLVGTIADQSDKALGQLCQKIHGWQLNPIGTEGYRTAEVTVGGVDTNALNSSTMECRAVPGLYFIGEVVDVTGWLGGYNFQWAWSSAYAAGRAIARSSKP